MNKIYTVLKGKFFVGLKVALLGVMMMGVKAGFAQYSITGIGAGNTYTQNFDAFRGTAITLPANWSVVTASYNATNPILTSGAATPTVATASGNNCYAGRASSASSDYSILQKQATSGSTAFIFSSINNIGSNIDGFALTWNVEQFASAGRASTIDISYSINGGAYITTGITGTSLYTSTTGTSTTFSLVSTPYSISISGLSIANTSTIDFKFTIANGSGSGSNAHVGIDDFTLYATSSAACTPPTGQATFTSFASITNSQANINFTAGTAGIGRLIAAAAASSIAGSPSSGTAYTTGLTTNFSTTTPTIATGEKVIYKSNGTSTTVTGLASETQYAVKVFEYNTSDCYITTGTGNTGSFYTLSDEPLAHAAAFSCNAFAYNQINLTFSAASTITNADGYIILQKTGSAPTGLPADASSYTVGATIGDATVAAIVNSTSATTQSITGLSASTNYYYVLIPYNSKSDLTAATYNYLTAATIPGSNCTTPATPPAITVSATTLTGFTYVQSAGPSASQTYNVSGTNLTPASGNINIAASADFEVSADNSTFSTSSINIAYTGGALAATPVYVRLKAGLSVGSYSSELIANTGGGATAKNVTVSGTVAGSGTSNIIEDGDPAFYTATLNIPYTTWQSTTISNTGSGTNGSIGVFRFKMQDGGASSPDADALPTIATGITFNYTGTASTIRTAAIFDGNTKVADVTTVNANSLVFSSLSNAVFTVADNGSQVLTLRVTFNTAVTDNDKLVYTVGSATSASAATSSQFGTISANSDNSAANDRNRIEVTADRLAFVQQPTTTTVNASMAPSVTVKGADVNNNLDLDYTGSISITSTGTLTGSPVAATASAGIATYSALVHTATGTGFTLTATTTGLASSNSIVSSTFDIIAVIYSTGDFRSLTAGTWTAVSGAGTATWEKYTSGTGWAAVPGVSPTGTTNVYIAHDIQITAGSYGGASIWVTSGNTLTWGSTWTAKNMYVYSGGILQINARFTMDAAGTFEVEDAGTVNFNYPSYSGTNLSSSLWNGIENFHPNSNFVIQNQASSAADFFIPAETDITANTYSSFTACFGNLIFNSIGTATYPVFGSSFTKNLTHKDLIFRSTTSSSNAVRLTSSNLTTTIGGNLTMESGFSRNVSVSTSAIVATINVKGNLSNNSSSTFTAINNTSGSVSLNIDGDLTETNGGIIIINAAGTSTVNLKGDLSVSSTSILNSTSTVASSSTFNFSGTGNGLSASTTQTIDISSGLTLTTRNQYIDFNINSGAYVQLINQNFELGKSGTVSVKTGGTLDFNFIGTTPLNITNYSTTPAFASAQGSVLKISSADGISGTSGTIGNVQLTAAPTYNQTATFWYIGKANQTTGTGLSVGSTGKIVYVNLLDNTKTLTLTNSTGISNGTTLDALGGRLEIQKGIVIGTTAADFTGTGRLVMSDGEYRISTILSPTSNTLPQLSNYTNYSLTGGTVNLNGANATQILAGNANYYKVAFSGSNTLGTNYKGISSGTTVSSGITVAETAVADVKSFSLGGTGTSFTMTDNSRYITDGGGTKPDAGGTYSLAGTTTIEFANATGAGVIRLGATPINYANVVVSGTDVSNTSTGTGIKFLSGGTFTVKTGAIFKHFNTAGFSNTGGSNATALSNLSPSNPAVTLEAGSTIDYAGAAQAITNVTDYQNLTLSGSGVKTASSGIVTVKGDFVKTSAATFTHNSGTVAFLGTTAQAYKSVPSITDFYNVTTNNAAGLTINNNMSVENELALTGSANLIMGAGDITLKSSVAKTASFAALTNGTITYSGGGLFSVERAININRKWRFLSVNTTTSQSINAAWQEGQAANVNGNPGYGLIITDASSTANGFDQSSFTPSMKYFDPLINDYTGIANTSGGISAHTAYMTFVRGDRTCTPGNSFTSTTILRTKGALITGDKTYTLTNAGDFAAIGNPYASRVSISSLAMSGLTNFIYVWDPKIAGANSLGGFQTLQKVGSSWQFPISLGGSYPSGINVPMDSIESGQAFFVRAQSAGATIKFTEASKATGSHDVNFTSGQPGSLIAVLKNAAGDAVDAAVVQYEDQNSNSTDYSDALKMANTSENVSIKSSVLLAVEQRKAVAADDTVHVNVTGYKLGNYQWNFKLINMDAPGLAGFVKDNFLNTLSPLNMSGDNNLGFTVSSAAGSYAADRFSVIFKPAAVVAVTLSTISAQRQPDKTVKVSWRSESEAGIDRYEIQHSGNGTSFSALGTQAPANNAGGNAAYAYSDAQPYAGVNYYRIKALSLSGEEKYTTVVKVAPADEKPSFSISPNPVKDKTIHLQAAGQEAGDYAVQLVSSNGQVIYKATISVSGNVFVKNIALPANTAAGNYKLSVTDSKGSVKTQSIIIE